MSDLGPRLERFLSRRLIDADSVVVSGIRPLVGGYSRVTNRFTATIDGRPHELVLRADSGVGESPVETDRLQEWAVLSMLSAHRDPPCPRALFVDEDGSELGAKSIISEFAGGGPFLSKIRADSDTALVDRAEEMCGLLVDIHSTDISDLPASLRRPPNWDTYLDEGIEQWRKAAAMLSESMPMLDYIAPWLDRNRPTEAPLTLVHGDFQPANQVYAEDGRLLAVDWEFSRIGDPREDIGWARWMESLSPPDIIGRDEAAFCESYCKRTGLGTEVVNPVTVAYFSILPGIRVFLPVLQQQQALVEGSNTSLHTAYVVGATVTAYEVWFRATRRIEAVQGGRL